MRQNIVVVGPNDANRQRIKDTLRRRFRNASVYIDDSVRGTSDEDILIFARDPDAGEPLDREATDETSLEASTRRAEFLFETTRLLSSSLSLSDVLNQTVARSQEVLGET